MREAGGNTDFYLQKKKKKKTILITGKLIAEGQRGSRKSSLKAVRMMRIWMMVTQEMESRE